MRPGLGYVAMAWWKAWREQEAVDRGSQPWRLDPLEAARTEAITRLGLAPQDPFFLHGLFQDALSGRAHALVKVLHGDGVYLLDLCQPIRQGRGGIWAVERIHEMETGDRVTSPDGVVVGYVDGTDEDYLLEQAKATAKVAKHRWRFDPLEVAKRTSVQRLGFGEGDRFFWRAAFREEGSGRQKAMVWAFREGQVYQIELYQPALQGEKGVWAVEHVMPLLFTNPPYSCT